MTVDESTTGSELARTFNYWTTAPEDPHPVLATLRSQCPVAHSDELGGHWLVTSYAGVRTVLTDAATFSSRVLTLPPEGAPPLLIPESIDPPDHAKYRRVFTPYFTPRRIEQMREVVRRHAVRLVEAFVANGGGDFVEAFTVPLPCTVFMELAGLPVADLQQLLEWKELFLRDGISDDPEKRQNVADNVMPAMMDYFNAALDEREGAADPPDDLLTGLLTGALDSSGTTMTRDEVLNSLLLLLAAGLDTVTSALGLSMELLALRPDLRRRIASDRDVIPSATEEFLRYFSLVTTCRQAMTDTVVDGVQVQKGDFLAAITPAACRDEAQFPKADEINLERSPNPHLAFGAGPHRCLGSHLTRMEMAVAFEEIHRLMPEYFATPDIERHHRFGTVIGIDSLHLTVGSQNESTPAHVAST
ncbi:cytochrome P450 [Mycobacterium sp.]|uniref:cytochrome P450 n=1 Tax=Mycobacterium sp. TaxID=1785 RepID=UPI003BAE3E40